MVTRESVELAKRIQRESGLTFHVATRFLPRRVRHPTYVLYAFFRLADQVVDDPDPAPPRTQSARLAGYERAVLGEDDATHPVLREMASLIEAHEIDPTEVTEFIGAMRQDIEGEPFETYTDLEGYLRGSAVAVAYMMLAVMDPAEESVARPHARALGEAFQLTNFLRDIREDAVEFDRLYLPLATLDAYDVDPGEIFRLRYSARFAHVVHHELERAESRYREGVAGIGLLPADCQFPVLLAAVLYAEYHRLITSVGYNVFSHPPAISTVRYLSLIARTWVAWRRSRDPEVVFYRVSPIDRSQPTPRRPPTMVGRLGERVSATSRLTSGE